MIKAHARDELGIDLDEMSNPLQASQDVHSATAHLCDIAVVCFAQPCSQRRRFTCDVCGVVRCSAHGFHGIHLGFCRLQIGFAGHDLAELFSAFA